MLSTQPVVEARDAAGQVVPAYTGLIQAAIYAGPAGATLLGIKGVNAVNGVATFTNLGIDLAGTGYELEFTALALGSVVSTQFDISVGPPAQIAVSQQPMGTPQNLVMQPAPTVEIQDAGGNRLTSDNSTAVDVRIEPATGSPGATLLGTTTITVSNGQAAFQSLAIDLAGAGYRLEFSSTGLPDLTTSAFNVTALSTPVLVVTTQPGGAAPLQPFATQPVVEVQDGGGATISRFIGRVDAAVSAGPGTVLNGTTTIGAVGGVAAFSDLQIDTAGSGYRLTFSIQSGQQVTTQPFDVSAGGGSGGSGGGDDGGDESCSSTDSQSSLWLTLLFAIAVASLVRAVRTRE